MLNSETEPLGCLQVLCMHIIRDFLSWNLTLTTY